jgi:multiple sugar transport system ATP-binding protein
MTLATRIGVLDQGRLVQVGPPREIYENPLTSTVAARLGTPRINLVPRDVLGDRPAPPGATLLGLRAEHVQVQAGGSADAKGLDARVQRIEILSDQRLVHLRLDGSGHELISVAPVAASLAGGDAVRLIWRQAMWFDAQGHRLPG